MSIGAQQQRSHNQVNKEDAPRHRQRTGTPGPTDDEDMTESSGEGDDTESTDGSDVIISPHNTEERKPEAPSPAYDLDILGYFRGVYLHNLKSLTSNRYNYSLFPFLAILVCVRHRDKAIWMLERPPLLLNETFVEIMDVPIKMYKQGTPSHNF